MRVLDIAHFTKQANSYVLFGDDGQLYIAGEGRPPVSVVQLPSIDVCKEVKLYVHEPWVCVTERFGTQATLVHMEKGSVREMSREDYHANVSSYSIGFLERDGRVLLIHQTEWNRLDIMDAATGECLTDRDVYSREAKPRYSDENQAWVNLPDESKSYLDYFHSLLHVSPDGAYFLSNGWMWHPIGQMICFRTDDFFKSYELSNIPVECNIDYNWDIPCTFIGHDRFVIAVDSLQNSPLYDPEDRVGYNTYKQLQFYCLSTPAEEDAYGKHILKKERDAFCTAFRPNTYGNIQGELIWNATHEIIVAITTDGACAVRLDGEVLETISECRCRAENQYPNIIPMECRDSGWHYHPNCHLLYHWSQEAGEIETRRFGCMGVGN